MSDIAERVRAAHAAYMVQFDRLAEVRAAGEDETEAFADFRDALENYELVREGH